MKGLKSSKIKNILTLRYDPGSTTQNTLSVSDFSPFEVSDVQRDLLKIVEGELYQMRQELNFKQVCIPLSSGIDSNFTLAVVRKYLPEIKVKCVSIGFGDPTDEILEAKERARTADSDFDAIIKDYFLRELPKLIELTKEPRWNLYSYYNFEAGKKLAHVFFTGDGGDELFGGYTFRYQKFLKLLKPQSTWKDRVKIYLSCHERDWVPDQSDMFGRGINFSWEDIYTSLRASFDNKLAPLDQIFLADFNGKLTQEWIPINNQFEKHLQVIIRSLFLTSSLIKFGTHIPWGKKYSIVTYQGKLPLYNYLITQKNYGQINPAKKGFAVNLSALWEREGSEIIEMYLNKDSDIISNEILSIDWLNKVKFRLEHDDPKDKERYISKLLSLLALEIWSRIFVTETMKGAERLI